MTTVFHRSRRAAVAVLFGIVPVAVASPQAAAPAELPAPTQGAWPKTEMRQGKYFAYAAPVGWNVFETTNGVDLINPDGTQSVSFVGLEGTPGSITPTGQIQKIAGFLKMRGLTFTETINRPSQGGFDTQELLFTYTDSLGRRSEGWAWSAVNNSFGRNNAYTELVLATSEVWRRDAQFMVATARLVSITDQQKAFQRDQLIRNNIPTGPGSSGGFNHPNTFTPHSNQAAMDRISARGAVARRDAQPLVDPSTGRTFIGHSDSYDHVRGGWVNPNDKTQLLKPVPP